MLEGKLVKLRALEEDDLHILRDWRNNKDIRIMTREYRLLNMINQKKWFETTHKENPPSIIMFGILNNKDKLIGVCGLTYIDWKNKHAEISCYIAKKNWQESKEAIDTISILMKYGFEELNLHRLWVEIFSIAKKNVELFHKLKFINEGKLRQKLWRNGEWWDSYIFSKLSTEYRLENRK
jgi:RimJ/RimL family protein N-acetyltransferase